MTTLSKDEILAMAREAGVCVRSGLYASPPSAVPVVEQLVEASTMLLSYTLACEGLLNAKPAGQIDIAQEAIAAGQKFIAGVKR